MTRMYIKSSLFFAVVVFVAASSLSDFCSAQKSNPNPNPSQLKSRTRPVIPFRHVTLAAPPGMVYIPGGSVTIKYSSSSSDTNSKKRVSLTSFYIDKTEVTNQQYRLFTEWVIDSIAVKNYLKDERYFYPIPENNSTADASAKSIENVMSDTSKHDSLNFIQKDVVATPPAAAVKDTTSFANRRINWSKVNHKDIFESNDDMIRAKIQPMLDPEGKIRQDLYIYTYYYARALGTNPKAKVGDIASFTLNVYPDEKIWIRDLTNAQVDILVENYFTTPPFDDYPVVGVTWLQARAFAYWRSRASSSYEWIADYLKYYRLNYGLPSEAQWVYAAGGDMKSGEQNVESNELPPISDSTAIVRDTTIHDSTAVVTAPEVDKQPLSPEDKEFSAAVGRDKDGKFLENFKQEEGKYSDDGGTFTLPVMSYAPNEFGIYNMVGNVAEWVLDAYSPSAFAFISDVNPVLLYDADSTEAEAMKRKVVRGGSFMSNARALSPFTRDEELQDKAHCYIGFRCVLPAPEILNKAVATRRKNTGSKKQGQQ